MSELDADALSEYAYLWDGSDPGWAVHSHFHHQEAVRILLPENGADLHFVKTLRNVLPEIAHESPPCSAHDSGPRVTSTAASWKVEMYTIFGRNARKPGSGWNHGIAA
jgi:hypothetical protein